MLTEVTLRIPVSINVEDKLVLHVVNGEILRDTCVYISRR
jgi:hypothetical protein